jgi:hypothetical protein
MRHFVQFHNPDNFGPYECLKSRGQIHSDKPVGNLIGDTVWSASRWDHPTRFVLCDAFVVDKISSRRSGRLRNVATGAKGYWFKSPVVIDEKPWFQPLRRVAGNFAFGLQAILDQDVIRGLETIATAHGILRSRPLQNRDPK